MKLLKTFNLNATKALTVISIVVVLLWALPYLLSNDPSAVGPAGFYWDFVAILLWGIYCAFAATEYRALRGLGIKPSNWLASMHTTLWLGALSFGAVAWAVYYIARQGGDDIYSSWIVTSSVFNTSPTLSYIATYGSFSCGHLLTGYIGALIGSVVSSANQSSLLARILFIIGIIVSLALVNGLLITLIEAFGEMRIGAPWPGLFFFTGLSIIICSAGIHFIARRIQP